MKPTNGLPDYLEGADRPFQLCFRRAAGGKAQTGPQNPLTLAAVLDGHIMPVNTVYFPKATFTSTWVIPHSDAGGLGFCSL